MLFFAKINFAVFHVQIQRWFYSPKRSRSFFKNSSAGLEKIWYFFQMIFIYLWQEYWYSHIWICLRAESEFQNPIGLYPGVRLRPQNFHCIGDNEYPDIPPNANTVKQILFNQRIGGWLTDSQNILDSLYRKELILTGPTAVDRTLCWFAVPAAGRSKQILRILDVKFRAFSSEIRIKSR